MKFEELKQLCSTVSVPSRLSYETYCDLQDLTIEAPGNTVWGHFLCLIAETSRSREVNPYVDLLSKVRQRVWINPDLNIHDLISNFFCQEIIFTTIEAYVEESDILYLHKTILQLRDILKPKVGVCMDDYLYNTEERLKQCLNTISKSNSPLALTATKILSTKDSSICDAVVKVKGGVKLCALILYGQI